MLAIFVFGPIQAIASVAQNLGIVFASADRAFHLLHEPAPVTDAPGQLRWSDVWLPWKRGARAPGRLVRDWARGNSGARGPFRGGEDHVREPAHAVLGR